MTETFIVIGPPRTGTSLTMGLLTKMGIWGGEDYREGLNNPCYYEDRTLFDWVNGKATAQEVVDKLAVKPKWGMKHPAIAHRWWEFAGLVENPRFLVTHRLNEEAQIRSHQKAIRPGQSDQDVRKRTAQYYRDVSHTTAFSPTFNITFEDWFTDDSNQLEIRPAEVVFRSKNTVYIHNSLRDGERIVTTDLSTPVEGMPLRTAENAEQYSDIFDTQREQE